MTQAKRRNRLGGAEKNVHADTVAGWESTSTRRSLLLLGAAALVVGGGHARSVCKGLRRYGARRPPRQQRHVLVICCTTYTTCNFNSSILHESEARQHTDVTASRTDASQSQRHGYTGSLYRQQKRQQCAYVFIECVSLDSSVSWRTPQ